MNGTNQSVTQLHGAIEPMDFSVQQADASQSRPSPSPPLPPVLVLRFAAAVALCTFGAVLSFVTAMIFAFAGEYECLSTPLFPIPCCEAPGTWGGCAIRRCHALACDDGKLGGPEPVRVISEGYRVVSAVSFAASLAFGAFACVLISCRTESTRRVAEQNVQQTD